MLHGTKLGMRLELGSLEPRTLSGGNRITQAFGQSIRSLSDILNRNYYLRICGRTKWLREQAKSAILMA